MKTWIISLMMYPCLLLAQTKQDDYNIYSKYLKVYQNEKKAKLNFVVKESTDYGIKYNPTEIKDIADDLRGYLNGDKVSASNVLLLYREFAKTIKTNTLWIPLILQLHQQMQNEYILKNVFSNNLRVTVIGNHEYENYFKSYKHLTEGWELFHHKFSNKAILIQLSQIASDGKRAVFYFSSQCGGLCGTGRLILFYKQNDEWEYFDTLSIWQS